MVDIWESFQEIDLAEIGTEFNLQTRVDRKYLVPRVQLNHAITGLIEAPKIVTVEGKLRSNYSSEYFDTPDFDLHQAAAHRRRKRFKVRIRSYVDSQLAFFEIKFKDNRSRTEKIRMPHQFGSSEIDPTQHDWLNSQLVDREFTESTTLIPALANTFQRRTLILPDGSRFTVDSNLAFDSKPAFNHPDWRIVETKSLGRKSELDSALWKLGYRPIRVSKYSIGVALKQPLLARNKWNIAIERAFRNGEYEAANRDY